MNEESTREKVWQAIKNRRHEDPSAPLYAQLISIICDVEVYNALFGDDKDWREVLDENE